MVHKRKKLEAMNFTLLEIRKTRCAFFRFAEKNYGIPTIKLYRMLSKGFLEPWEHKGLLGCIREYAGDQDVTDVYDWYKSLPDRKHVCTDKEDAGHRRMLFYEFMQSQGLCRSTLTKHMQNADWTRMNIVGWDYVWNQFKNEKK